MQNRNIFQYFERKNDSQSSKLNALCDNIISSSKSSLETKRSKLENDETITPIESNSSYYERDPGKRISILQYPIDKQDEVRRIYINMGPYQPEYDYPLVSFGKQNHRFQYFWFIRFQWLEYSIKK